MLRSEPVFKPDGRGMQWPRVCSYPEYDQTYGPEAYQLCVMAHLYLDPWQRNILDVMLAVRPDGKWTCFENGIVVPRQNGKGSVLEARALAGLFLLDERLVMWSAHEYKTAMEGFRRLRELIEDCPDLDRQVRKVINTNGEEGIELRSGARIRFIARSKGSGRGFSGDCMLLDEWFAGTAAQVSALMPTLSARPNPQIVYTSSPPLDDPVDDEAPGAMLFALRDRGELGDDPGLAWFDWSVKLDPETPEGRAALADHDMWYRSNPALGIRIREETIERELRSMGPIDFARERLNVWPKRAGSSNLIDVNAWQRQADPMSVLGEDVALAVDITPTRDYAAIAAYGINGRSLGHLEVVDHRPGTDWLVDRILDLVERWNPVAVAIDPRGPAASLLVPLERAGMEVGPSNPEEAKRGQLVVPGSSDVAAACGQIVDSIAHGADVHIDQGPLSIAVRGAKTRPLGDGMAWARRLAAVDISPLCAVTLARWAYITRIDYVRDTYDPDANIW